PRGAPPVAGLEESAPPGDRRGAGNLLEQATHVRSRAGGARPHGVGKPQRLKRARGLSLRRRHLRVRRAPVARQGCRPGAAGPTDRARARAWLPQARPVGVSVQSGRHGALRSDGLSHRRDLQGAGSARRPLGRHDHHGETPVKILYTPNMICPAIPAADRARILELAGPGSTLVETRDVATQRKEVTDTDVVFGRVPNDVFLGARRLRYYHSIGAGVDAILTPELVASEVILASEKGEVGIHLAEHAFALLLALTRGLHTALRRPDYDL